MFNSKGSIMNKKVVIAALLHDIGKLIQRANNEYIYHGSVGYDYLKAINFDEEILEAVKNHHSKKLSEVNTLKNDFLTYLIYEADNLSAAHDRKDNLAEKIENKWESDSSLKTVFSFLNGVSKDEFAYPARDLNPENKTIYPLKKNDIKATQNKYEDLKKIIDNNLGNNITPNSLLELLESTMTYVPSSTDAKQNLDISLFDHSKTTAAIASCIYEYFVENNITDYKDRLYKNPNHDEKYFLLVSGDISGIQDFIYTISSKGALKSLRARSFYLEMMLEHIVDEILSQLDMFRCNLLYTGGGHFYMLLPNTEKTKNVLQEAQEKINDWFINEFGNALYIAIAASEASSNDLNNTRDIFSSVSKKLSQKKLSRYNKSQLKKLTQPNKNKSSRECKFCKTSSKKIEEENFIDGKIEVCKTCYNLYKLGENLVRTLKFTVSEREGDISKGDISLNLPSLNDKQKYLTISNEKISESDDRIYAINDRLVGENYTTKLFVGNYSFQIGEKIADFSELVEFKENKRIKRLAVLRCDVDNLGQTFVNGFKEADKILNEKKSNEEQKGKDKQKTYSTLSRVTSLSRQLSLFFKFYINNICKSKINGEADVTIDNFSLNGNAIETEKRLSIVYSGGDDVFVVGEWLDVLNFAFDLREAFKVYTCNKLTFSGGLGFFSVGYPISQMAAQAGDLEDVAKKYDDSTKDSISLFGKADGRNDTYHWDEFKEKVFSKIQSLMKLCYFDEKNPIESKIFLSTAMCYKIKQLITPNYEGKKDDFNVARLAYTLARMKPSDKKLKDNDSLNYNWAKFRGHLYKWSLNESKSLLTAIDLVIYLNRNED